MVDVSGAGDDIDFITAVPPVLLNDLVSILSKPFGGQRFSLFPKIIMSGHALSFFVLFSPVKPIKGMEQDKNKVFRLEGKIQHYAWGGSSFLPRLLSMPNPEGRPFAEYWMGAHDNASSELVFGPASSVKLNEYIRAFPKELLGAHTAEKFGRLPYLL